MFSAPPPSTLSKCRGSLSIALAHEERKFNRLAMLCPFRQSHHTIFVRVCVSEWFSDYVSNCLLKWACLQPRCHIGPVNLAVFTLRPCWSPQFAHCVHVHSCLLMCVTSPLLFIYLIISFGFTASSSVTFDRVGLSARIVWGCVCVCVCTLSSVRH